LRDFVEIETMAMGAATATNGDATPVDIPGRRLYANGGDEKNGASLHHKHQHSSRSSDDDDVPDDDSIMERTPSMIFVDAEFNSSTLQGLSKLRKNRQFCDVILQVCVIITLFIIRLLFYGGFFWRSRRVDMLLHPSLPMIHAFVYITKAMPFLHSVAF